MIGQRYTAWLLVTALCILGGCRTAPQIEVRDASGDPVDGWIQMLPRGEEPRPVWVAPEATLTSADIADAERSADNLGRLAVTLELTDRATGRLEEFSARKVGEPVAVLLDGELISAPIVMSHLSRRIMILGVTEAEVERIVAAFGT